MPHVIAIFGAKGGTGKTTLCFNLAAILARVGLRTALLDLDPSGDASSAAGISGEGDVAILDSSRLRIRWADGTVEVEKTSAPAASASATDAAPAPSRTPASGVKRPRLPGAPRPSPRVPDLTVVAMDGDSDEETTAEHTYAITHRLRRDFDLAIIDCPGRWCPSTRAAVREADLVLIPLELPLDALSARAARRAARRIADLSAKPHPFGLFDSAAVSRAARGPIVRAVGWSVSFRAPTGGAVGGAGSTGASPAEIDTGTVMASDGGEDEPLPMLRSIIPREPAVAEALAAGRAVIDFDPGARATCGFADAAREVLDLLRSLPGRDATKHLSRRDATG